MASQQKMESLPLFRREALQHQSERLNGSVNIAVPLAWHVVGMLLLLALVTTIVFLSAASYARVQTVPGSIALDTGIARIVSSRSGVVQKVMVSEGQRVKIGDTLSVIRVEESLIGGKTAPQRIREALQNQDSQLAQQSRLLLKASSADQQRLKAQVAGDIAAVASLQSQIAVQKDMISAAESSYDVAVSVAQRGFISKMELDQRRTTLLDRRQELAQLEQSLAGKQADIASARWSMRQTAMSAQASAASASSSRGAVSQQEAETDLTQGYQLTSPVNGTVTTLTARIGQPVTSDQQLMLVVPDQAKPRVELYVPTAAAAFLAAGQEVRVAIDAFPYQTYGTVKARILTVPRAATTRDSGSGPVPVYLVTAALEEPWIMAFGRRQPLLPGMTLSARIIEEKRSLIKWLFEPLFAVRQR